MGSICSSDKAPPQPTSPGVSPRAQHGQSDFPNRYESLFIEHTKNTKRILKEREDSKNCKRRLPESQNRPKKKKDLRKSHKKEPKPISAEKKLDLAATATQEILEKKEVEEIAALCRTETGVNDMSMGVSQDVIPVQSHEAKDDKEPKDPAVNPLRGDFCGKPPTPPIPRRPSQVLPEMEPSPTPSSLWTVSRANSFRPPSARPNSVPLSPKRNDTNNFALVSVLAGDPQLLQLRKFGGDELDYIRHHSPAL